MTDDENSAPKHVSSPLQRIKLSYSKASRSNKLSTTPAAIVRKSTEMMLHSLTRLFKQDKTIDIAALGKLKDTYTINLDNASVTALSNTMKPPSKIKPIDLQSIQDTNIKLLLTLIS